MDLAGSGRLFRKNNVPHALHKKGFVSIGCAPCMRAIQMKTSEPDDGGGISHKEWLLQK
jgi:3'-phosphoadenosine 5'-phosphosulfate sulfotransferase (PAPS reductase)/FAD synthetase